MTTKEMTKNEKGVDVYESKWGFHPCNREIYAKLRKLNYWLLQAKKSASAYTRWFRKEEQNRVIRKKIRNEKGQVIGYEIIGPKNEPKLHEPFCSFEVPKRVPGWRWTPRTHKTYWKTSHIYTFSYSNVYVNTFGIEQDYRNAKHPRHIDSVNALVNSPEEIDRLYKLVIDRK